MKDRTSKYPGRVRLVPVEGMENTYTMSWADEPLQEGTPLNKATLLSDTVAAALRLPQDDPTVNDALACIVAGFSRVHVSNAPPSASDIEKAGDVWINQGGMPYFMYVSLGIGVWVGVPVAGKTMKTEVFTSSTVWTKPAGFLGTARITVYGAGASGAYSSSSGANGGGGGRMATWVGELTEDSYTVTVGKGGDSVKNANVNFMDGNSGGASSFGTIVSAAGGSGTGSGGSGAGADYGRTGYDFGGGGGVYSAGSGNTNSGNGEVGGDGVDTSSLGDVPDIGKGTGKGGSASGSSSYARGGGGGGGYGGKGGNGGAYGGGGGGGYGSSGNGGDGCKSSGGTAGSGGYGAGGGGAFPKGATTGAGGSGIVIIQYYT